MQQNDYYVNLGENEEGEEFTTLYSPDDDEIGSGWGELSLDDFVDEIVAHRKQANAKTPDATRPKEATGRAEPTPRPWERDRDHSCPRLCNTTNDANSGYVICEFYGPDAEANFALTFRAVNHHAELLAVPEQPRSDGALVGWDKETQEHYERLEAEFGRFKVETAALRTSHDELLDITRRAMLNEHNNGILMRRTGYNRNEKETQWWNEALAAIKKAEALNADQNLGKPEPPPDLNRSQTDGD